jgi:hypothetical protein
MTPFSRHTGDGRTGHGFPASRPACPACERARPGARGRGAHGYNCTWWRGRVAATKESAVAFRIVKPVGPDEIVRAGTSALVDPLGTLIVYADDPSGSVVTSGYAAGQWVSFHKE